MTTTPDTPFEDFTLALISLVETEDRVERFDIFDDANKLITSCPDSRTRTAMRFILDKIFAGKMFDAEREHGVIRKGDGDFAIVITCEGYFTHGDDGKIKPID